MAFAQGALMLGWTEWACVYFRCGAGFGWGTGTAVDIPDSMLTRRPSPGAALLRVLVLRLARPALPAQDPESWRPQ